MFFFNDTATTEIYTLSLHAALPICLSQETHRFSRALSSLAANWVPGRRPSMTRPVSAVPTKHSFEPTWIIDRKSTRLNSSHANISYAVFCLKKKTHLLVQRV